ncbi:parallel beta-helix repeat (two copies) [Friedmanniella luteola]|uniref:Parallel beta-helix repeat (Two copies) n=1 Tax=Friedmanniella luteola TaxID=546871 RepID=A0A1H1LIM7_9ACTN|nr:right-handed parallel beta-helix repeat-containing protein [Friedmanniella luteola]SDR74441.1 parallel beta-helix repeat (two copies) [Friedmanniella luteola]
MPRTATPAPFRRAARVVVTAALALAAGAAPLLVLPGAAWADTQLVVDGFDRSVASGWGKPDTGSAWTGISGGSATSVGGSEGRVSKIQGGRSFKAYQGAVSVRDTVLRAEFTVPVSRNFQYSIEARRQADGSAYSARARIDAAGVLHVDLYRTDGAGRQTVLKEMTLASQVPVGRQLVVKLSATGTDPVIARAKVYVKGATEPGWQVTALDRTGAITGRGHTGLQAYNGAGNPTVDLTTQAFVVSDVAADLAPAHVEGDTTDTAAPLAVRHGAGPVGSARYPVPSDALFVSPTGSDTNPGTEDQPFRTLGKAVTRNWSGQTIVLRAGSYHESVLVAPGRAATIQPYPGEAVWFDGTRAVTGFAPSGRAFVAPWDVALDSSPTYTKGAPDGTTPGWRWIDPEHPMAAHPDMVWLDGVELEQVASLGQVVPGTFFVDRGSKKLYLGSDPAGRSVRSSDLQSAFSLRAPGTVLRGFGIRRYADSVWQQGVVTSYFERMTLDNMTVLDSATGGIGMFKPGSVIRNTTVDGSGQVGIHANQADGLLLDDVSVTDSNDERFNPAPSAGGIKITQTRGITLRDSEIRRTHGSQFWTDQSVFNVDVVNNEIIGSTRFGIVLEISSTGTVVDNVIADNAADGVLVANTDKVSIWNNTIVRNRRAIAFTQDSRRIEQLQVSGHDARRPQPDLAMPWVIGNSSVGNNVLAAGHDATSVLAVESYALVHDAGKLKITSNGNVFSQTALGVPNATATWARQGEQPMQFVLLDDYRDSTGQERTSINPLATTPVDAGFRLRAGIASRTAEVAQPLPAHVAVKAGLSSGARTLGAAARPAS